MHLFEINITRLCNHENLEDEQMLLHANNMANC
jgi:hypothetical protein